MPDTADRWRAFLSALTDEELERYRQIVGDQIAHELQHGWLHNVKANIMANNKLKYWRVDAGQRDRLRREWNQPARWPLWLGAASLLLFGVWMWRVLRRREEAK